MDKRDKLYTTDDKTGEEWMKHFGDVIMDPDGWRKEGMDFFKELITYPQYMDRLSECTMKISNNLSVRFFHHNKIKSD